MNDLSLRQKNVDVAIATKFFYRNLSENIGAKNEYLFLQYSLEEKNIKYLF